MTAGDTQGAGGPREPYQQIVRTIVEGISQHIEVAMFYSVVIAHEGNTFVTALVEFAGQPAQVAKIDHEEEHCALFYEVFWQEVAEPGGDPTQLYAASFNPKSNSFVYHGSHPFDPARGVPEAQDLQNYARQLSARHTNLIVDGHLFLRSAMTPAAAPTGAHLTDALFTRLGGEVFQQTKYLGADWAGLNAFFTLTSGPEGTKLEQVDAIFYMEALNFTYGVFSRAKLEPYAVAYTDALADGKPFHHAVVQITINKLTGDTSSSASWDDWAERIRITPENWRDVASDTHPLLQRYP